MRYSVLVLLSLAVALVLFTGAPFPAAAQQDPTAPPPTPFPTVPAQPTPMYITATPPSPATPTLAALVPIPIEIGEMAHGTLPPGEYLQQYRFDGTAGQVVALRLTSPHVASMRLFLQDDAGNELSDWDTAREGGINLVHSLPRTGPYQVIINAGAVADRSTEYTLQTAALPIKPIAYGESVEAAVRPETPASVFSFDGGEGDLVVLTLDGMGFIPFLVLEVENGQAYRQLTTGGAFLQRRYGGVAHIGPLTLPLTGHYRAIARALGGAPKGLYTFTLEKIAPVVLDYGATVEGELTAAAPAAYYAFEGAYGDIIDIQVFSENGGANADTVLTLYGGPQLQQLAYDDDSGQGFDPEIMRYLLTQDGTYIIAVRPFTRGDTAAFTLSLARDSGSALDAGPQRVRMDKPPNSATLTFEGRAGETVRLVLEVLRGVNTPMVQVTQRGVTLLSLSATSSRRLASDFVVPDDGIVLVQLESGGYSEGIMEVSIERLE